jgi:hypothetical protein
MPFKFDRELVGPPGEALVCDILSRIASIEMRKRAQKPEAARLRARTINVLLANLAVAALNRQNPKRVVALSLNGNDYANSGLSFTTVQLAFNALQTMGLAIGKKGVAKPDGANERRGMLSRLRATSPMRDLMREHGLEPEYIRNPPRDLIVLKDYGRSPLPEPSDVTITRPDLERINALLGAADLHLSDDVWERISATKKPAEDLTSEERRHRQYLGDMTAKQLYRVFTRRWDQGGRLYGGWWIGVPKQERKLIRIDGEPTVELDYGQLHPTMLFAMAKKQLDYDAYKVRGFSRELGKETFMRLLNRTPDRGGGYIRRGGEVTLPEGVSPAQYGQMLKEHLAPVRHLLGQGMGLRLQRQDSDLALAVLAELAEQQIVALPVHDSFIVKQQHADTLKAAMASNFRRLHGYEAIVK